MRVGIWKYDYRLDKMSLKELWLAYFLYPAIQAYIILALVSAYFGWKWHESGSSLLPAVMCVLAVFLLYPFVWYALHRYVLHGRFLYRSKWTARVWKRIHFDHHRDPLDLKVLFGALYTTLPTIALVTIPTGYLIAGTSGAMIALCTGLVITCFYEFVHCIQHLRYAPEWPYLKYIKRLHLQHHFHNENYNYGITSYLPDKLFSSYGEDPKHIGKSDTVFNLGYTHEEVRKYPWVARCTEDLEEEKCIAQGVQRRFPEAG